MRTCFDYLWKNYIYERFYDSPSTSKMPSYAEYMFTKKWGTVTGMYGASFAYIAKVLGYDVRVAIGQISSSRGGMTEYTYAYRHSRSVTYKMTVKNGKLR